MKTDRTNTKAEAADRLATSIARQIICWKLSIAERLNNLVNRYPARRQKTLLILFVMVMVASLIIRVWTGTQSVPLQIETIPYKTAHIGQPSELPRQPIKPTDSLTLKK